MNLSIKSRGLSHSFRNNTSRRTLREKSYREPRSTRVFGGTKWYPTSLRSDLWLDPSITRHTFSKYRRDRLSLPFGVAVAIYMAEIANTKTRNLLKPIIELLAGIPSVVYGFFGLVVIVPLIQKTLDLPVGETAFAGSVVLAIMALRPSSR